MSAHMQEFLKATERPDPHKVNISEIASTGEDMKKFCNQEKVQRMRQQLRSGNTLPPVRIVKLTPELREKYDVQDPSKKFYLTNGHHRLAANKAEGRTQIDAIDLHEGKRL